MSESDSKTQTSEMTFTREQAIEHLMIVTGMSRDQIESGHLDVGDAGVDLKDLGIFTSSVGMKKTITSKSDAKAMITHLKSKGDATSDVMADFLKIQILRVIQKLKFAYPIKL